MQPLGSVEARAICWYPHTCVKTTRLRRRQREGPPAASCVCRRVPAAKRLGCDNRDDARGNRIYNQSRAPPRALLENLPDQTPHHREARSVCQPPVSVTGAALPRRSALRTLRAIPRGRNAARPGGEDLPATREGSLDALFPPSLRNHLPAVIAAGDAAECGTEAVRLDGVDKCFALRGWSMRRARANNVAMRARSI